MCIVRKTVFNRIHTELLTLLASICLFLSIQKNILKTQLISFNAKLKLKQNIVIETHECC
jgi:hypothetical protein